MHSSTTIPPYAPTASYAGLSSSSGPASRLLSTTSISLDQEVRLHTTVKQRELFDSLAELYAIIISLDFLEKAYLRDSIAHTEYTPTCLRLLAQYNGILRNNEQVAAEFGSLDSFKTKYAIECSHAMNRLKVGVPATVEHAVVPEVSAVSGAAGGGSTATAAAPGASARAVAEATGVSYMAMLPAKQRILTVNLLEFHYVYGRITT